MNIITSTITGILLVVVTSEAQDSAKTFQSINGVIFPEPSNCMAKEIGGFVQVDVTGCEMQPCQLFGRNNYHIDTTFVAGRSTNSLYCHITFMPLVGDKVPLLTVPLEEIFLEGQTYRVFRDIIMPDFLHGETGRIWINIFEATGSHISRCVNVDFPAEAETPITTSETVSDSTTLEPLPNSSTSPTVPSTTESAGSSTTMNPDIFTCLDRPDGMYPHPFDCAKFINCLADKFTEFICPHPLLFDIATGTCNIPELVDCEIRCTGKQNGIYPHPHACHLFIGCVDEVVSVYSCPPPLLFDPTERRCNIPDLVLC